MAITYLAGNIIQGLAADTKPTTNVPANISRFYETDTRLWYSWDGTNWLLQEGIAQPTYAYNIFVDGSNYKARNNVTGKIEFSGTDPAAVIQSAVNTKKDIFIEAGTYTLPAAGYASGYITFPQDTPLDNQFHGDLRMRVHLSPNAKMIVRNGYTSGVWVISKGTNSCEILGGRYSEAGTPAQNWYPYYLYNDQVQTTSQAHGICFNTFGDCFVDRAKASFILFCAATFGWINQNIFRNVVSRYSKMLVEFSTTGLTHFANGNKFVDFMGQSAATGTSAALGGFVNVAGDDNVFEDCWHWDIDANPPNVAGITITANGRRTQIRGGNISFSMSDSGANTAVYGKYFLNHDTASEDVIPYPTVQQIKFKNVSTITDGAIPGMTVTPVASNSYCMLQMVPTLATPTTAAERGIMRMCNSALGANQESLDLMAYGSTGYYISAQKSGTGTVRDLFIAINFTPVMTLSTSDNGAADFKLTLGTAATQKIGFYGKTPIVQKAANANTSGANLAAVETEVNELKQLLRDYGLLAP